MDNCNLKVQNSKTTKMAFFQLFESSNSTHAKFVQQRISQISTLCLAKPFFFFCKNSIFFFLEWLWFSFVASLCRTFAARNPTYRLSIGHCHYVVREFHFNHIVRALPDGDWYSWLFMVICGNLFFGMHFYCDLSARNQRQNPI